VVSAAARCVRLGELLMRVHMCGVYAVRDHFLEVRDQDTRCLGEASRQLGVSLPRSPSPIPLIARALRGCAWVAGRLILCDSQLGKASKTDGSTFFQFVLFFAMLLFSSSPPLHSISRQKADVEQAQVVQMVSGH
jgi:hypothetical protein